MSSRVSIAQFLTWTRHGKPLIAGGSARTLHLIGIFPPLSETLASVISCRRSLSPTLTLGSEQ